jgi:putative PEP-CTERM system histidine kinase
LDDIAVVAHGSAAAIHLAFAAYLILKNRLTGQDSRASALLLAALLCSAGWAACSAVAAVYVPQIWPAGAALLDLARYGLWFAFLATVIAGPTAAPATSALPRLRWALMLVLLLAVLQQGWRVTHGAMDTGPARWLTITLLALPVGGLLLLEQLFRNLGDDSRWNAKPVCIGLACLFASDVYLHSTALMFGGYDTDTLAMRGALHTLAVPFLFMAASRRADWLAKLKVSRKAAFHSATLVLAGVYLLFMSSIGYYLRFFGGDWGRALQVSLLFASVALLVTLALSGSVRAKLRVFVGKHFFSYRYDYREEWLRFTAQLYSRGASTSGEGSSEVGVQVVRALADLVECPAGSLWTRSEAVGGQAVFEQTATWNMPANTATEAPDSAFATFMRDKAWVMNLDEYRNAPRRYEGLALPTWLLSTPDAWIVVPLLAGTELLGFVLLAKPRTAIDLDWEVLDLLKTASRQAAGYLAQMQATEALLEARKFDAFNRMSAFVVHDLKNIVTQLSLMLKNAQRLRDNPEFQEDMLMTVESSLEKMRRMMLQLREGATPPGGSSGVDLAPLVQRLQALAQGQGRHLDVQQNEALATRGHDERLERVLGHLVQNALDATPTSGRVWLHLERYSGQVKIVVGDTGTGMDEAFVKTRLFKPFSSTKRSGMGVGSYESEQYIRELGGRIEVDSALGRGTVITVMLPLFERQRASDLLARQPN